MLLKHLVLYFVLFLQDEYALRSHTLAHTAASVRKLGVLSFS